MAVPVHTGDASVPLPLLYCKLNVVKSLIVVLLFFYVSSLPLTTVGVIACLNEQVNRSACSSRWLCYDDVLVSLSLLRFAWMVPAPCIHRAGRLCPAEWR